MYIHVKVTAGIKKEKILVLKKDHFAISVREVAERNMANKRVVSIIADYFKVEPAQVKIISGHHSPSKILSITER